jgi:DNA polymerase sigma
MQLSVDAKKQRTGWLRASKPLALCTLGFVGEPVQKNITRVSIEIGRFQAAFFRLLETYGVTFVWFDIQ